MKNVVRSLSASVLCMFFALFSVAQSDTVLLNQLEIIAERTPLINPGSARVVTIIDKKQIENSPAQNLNDILRHAAGVDIRQRGSNGVQADISVRGGSFDQTLILLNGIKINDPQTGHHSLNIPLDIEMIERIEILQGPAARVYGANAFAGAINIITKSHESNQLELFLAGGKYAYHNKGVKLSLSTGKISNQLMLSHKASDGYMENTDFETAKLFYSADFKSKAGLFNLQHGTSYRAFGAQSFYTPKYPNQYEAIKTSITSLQYQVGKSIRYTHKVWYRYNTDRFELFRSDPMPWYSGHNYHQTSVSGSEINISGLSSLGRTRLGAEVRAERIMSNVLGEIMNSPVPVRGEDEAMYTHNDERRMAAIFLDHSYSYRNLLISGGIMGQAISSYKPAVYPGVDLNYNINKNNSLFGSLNKSLRLPTYTELYYSGPVNQGNPDLKPEEAVVAEIGWSYVSQNIKAHTVVFHRHGKNLIDWVKKSGDNKWTTLNLTQVNAKGTEFSISWIPGPKTGNSFFKRIGINYSHVHLSKQSGDFVSYYVMDYLKHKAGVAVEHSLYKNLAFSWCLTFNDRNGTYTNYPTNNELPYKSFIITDLRLQYSIKNSVAYIEATNLFDTDYFDLGNVPLPGRWIKLGANVKLNLKKEKN